MGTGDGQVVEIGTWAGGATVALALGCRDGGRGVVHTIDPVSHPDLDTNWTRDEVRDAIRHHAMWSQQASVAWRRLSGGSPGIRLLWVDGDHTLRRRDQRHPALA